MSLTYFYCNTKKMVNGYTFIACEYQLTESLTRVNLPWNICTEEWQFIKHAQLSRLKYTCHTANKWFNNTFENNWLWNSSVIISIYVAHS